MSRGTLGHRAGDRQSMLGRKEWHSNGGGVPGSRVDILGVSCFCAPITVGGFLGPLVFEQGGSPGPGL